MSDSVFMGQGEVFVRRVINGVASSGWSYLGDSNAFKLSHAQEFDDVLESTSGNRAVLKHITTKTTTNISINMQEWSMENITRAINGSASGALVAGSVSDYAMSVYANSIEFLPHQNVSTVVLTKGVTALVLGTDYTVDLVTGKIVFLPASAVITGSGANAITADYAYADGAGTVQALMHSNYEYEIKFVGINVADGGSAVVVNVFKASLNLPKEMAFLDAKHSDLMIEGMLLQDTSRPAGTSRFYTITKQAV